MYQSKTAKRLSVLLGTASFGTLAVTSAAYGQASTITITGSLITGQVSIGVPVSNLGQQDFIEAGAVDVLNLLQTIPSLTIPPTNSPAFGAGTLHFANNVQIHGLGVGDTLMMQDGRRWPLQGYDGERVDPAIFPQLAIDRVDVLAAGASATYGADATAGVINIVLKRNYDGAQSFLRLGAAPGAGNESVTAAQLYGTSWDTGNITMTYEYAMNRQVESKDLFYYTWDFGDAGYEGFDFTQIASSVPGIVTDGPTEDNGYGKDRSGVFVDRNWGVNCANCMSVPGGIGPDGTFNWSQLTSGVNRDNILNPWVDGWARPLMESNAFVATFTQRLTPNLNLFGVDLGPVRFVADAIYSNRRFKQNYPTDQGQGRENLSPISQGYIVPENNPYYPIDTPDGTDLRVHFSLDPDIDTPIVSGGQVNGRWQVGFEFDQLPWDWHGRFDYTVTENKSYGYDRGGIINGGTKYGSEMVRAALGNTVTYNWQGTDITFAKPDNVPFLNPFCDSTQFDCISPATLQYIQGYRDQFLRSHFSEWNFQLDGPLFDLPAGPIMVAAAYNHLSKNLHYYQEDNTNSPYRDIIVITGDHIGENSNAYVFQANIPFLGDGFNFPLFQSLDLELGYRFDDYDDLSKLVKTPKIGVNWGVGWGLTLRGSWGKSFRTPKGEEISASGVGIAGRNPLSGAESTVSLDFSCNDIVGDGLQGTAIALVNPTCSTDPEFAAPVVITVSGPPGQTGPLLAPFTSADIPTDLGPQNAQQYNLGFNWTPDDSVFNGLLNGLNLDFTYWKLDYKDLIGGSFRGGGPDDPLSTGYYITIPRPDLAITAPENADFWNLVQTLAAIPTRTARAPQGGALLLTKAIEVSLNGNIGQAEYSGIEFSGRYDWEMFNMGTFNVGFDASYTINAKLRQDASDPWEDPFSGEFIIDENDPRTLGSRLVATGNQLKKVRYRAGWTDGTWNFNTFLNYYGHSPQDTLGPRLTPDCFYRDNRSAGDCYPGSPYYGPYGNDRYPNVSPANVLVDVSFGYNTGNMPTNEYLRNIQIQFGVTNLFDKNPPLGVHPLRSRGTGVAAYDRNYPDLKREVSLTITKTW